MSVSKECECEGAVRVPVRVPVPGCAAPRSSLLSGAGRLLPRQGRESQWAGPPRALAVGCLRSARRGHSSLSSSPDSFQLDLVFSGQDSFPTPLVSYVLIIKVVLLFTLDFVFLEQV